MHLCCRDDTWRLQDSVYLPRGLQSPHRSRKNPAVGRREMGGDNKSCTRDGVDPTARSTRWRSVRLFFHFGGSGWRWAGLSLQSKDDGCPSQRHRDTDLFVEQQSQPLGDQWNSRMQIGRRGALRSTTPKNYISSCSLSEDRCCLPSLPGFSRNSASEMPTPLAPFG